MLWPWNVTFHGNVIEMSLKCNLYCRTLYKMYALCRVDMVLPHFLLKRCGSKNYYTWWARLAVRCGASRDLSVVVIRAATKHVILSANVFSSLFHIYAFQDALYLGYHPELKIKAFLATFKISFLGVLSQFKSF